MRASAAMPQSFIGRVDAARLFWIVVLLMVGGYFRLTAIQDTIVDAPIRADAKDYYLAAYNLVHHGTYSRSQVTLDKPDTPPPPDAYRSPGMSLMMAPFMSLWPDHTTIVRRVLYVNVAIGLVTIVAIFLAASVVLPLPAAIAVGLPTACAPHLVSLTVYMLSETPGAFFVAVLLAVCAAGVPVSRRRRIAYFSAMGAVIGVLALFRPPFAAFAPLIALAYSNRSDRWHAFLLGSLGAGIVIAPWIIRNMLNVPPDAGPSLAAATLMQGSYRGFMFNGDKSTFPMGWFADPRFEQLSMNLPGAVEEVTRKFMADPAGSLVWYLLEKPGLLFQWNNVDGIGDVFVYPLKATPFWTDHSFIAVHALYRAAHIPFLVLAAAGAALAWWPRAMRSLPQAKLHVLRMASLLLVFLYLVHVPFVVNTRYSLPVYPAMYLLAVLAAVVVLRAAWRYGRRAPPATNAEAAAAAAIPATRALQQRTRPRGARHGKDAKRRT